MALLNGQLPDSALVTVGMDAYGRPARLRPEAAASWNRMRAAGMPHDVADTYRDLERQKAYEKNPPNSKGLAAKAGTSPHGWGLAVDARGACLRWLAAHGRAYGWVRTIKAEDWHFEYQINLDTHARNIATEGDMPLNQTDLEAIDRIVAGRIDERLRKGGSWGAAVTQASLEAIHRLVAATLDERLAWLIGELPKHLPAGSGVTSEQVATAVRAVIDGARITTN